MQDVRIIIADDHRMVRKAWEVLLTEKKGITVCGQASNGQEVLDLLQKVKAEIVLMDLDMPVMNGIEATEKIKSRFPWVKVIVLTMQKDYAYIEQLFALGASGFLTKNASENELFDALEKVTAGGRYLSEEVGNVLSERLLLKEYGTANVQTFGLTGREMEIIKLIIAGNTTSKIADVLFLSVKTVESHRRNIFKKLSVKNVAQLISKVKNRII